MQTMMIPCVGVAGQRLLDQMAKALDPIATLHAGQPAARLVPLLREAWRDTFGVELTEPALSRCAAAIANRQPWQLALWSNDGAELPGARVRLAGGGR